jgi:hypothetical protein
VGITPFPSPQSLFPAFELPGGADFDGAADARARALGRPLSGLVEVLTIEQAETAELFYGFGKGAVGDEVLAVPHRTVVAAEVGCSPWALTMTPAF